MKVLADVAKLVDALDLESSENFHESSSLSIRTKQKVDFFLSKFVKYYRMEYNESSKHSIKNKKNNI